MPRSPAIGNHLGAPVLSIIQTIGSTDAICLNSGNDLRPLGMGNVRRRSRGRWRSVVPLGRRVVGGGRRGVVRRRGRRRCVVRGVRRVRVRLRRERMVYGRGCGGRLGLVGGVWRPLECDRQEAVLLLALLAGHRHLHAVRARLARLGQQEVGNADDVVSAEGVLVLDCWRIRGRRVRKG